MPTTVTTPVAGRFVRSYESYVHPARLAAWETRMIEDLPRAMRKEWPTPSISGSDGGWDDSER